LNYVSLSMPRQTPSDDKVITLATKKVILFSISQKQHRKFIVIIDVSQHRIHSGYMSLSLVLF
jgi:hypothetical protein